MLDVDVLFTGLLFSTESFLFLAAPCAAGLYGAVLGYEGLLLVSLGGVYLLIALVAPELPVFFASVETFLAPDGAS